VELSSTQKRSATPDLFIGGSNTNFTIPSGSSSYLVQYSVSDAVIAALLQITTSTQAVVTNITLNFPMVTLVGCDVTFFVGSSPNYPNMNSSLVNYTYNTSSPKHYLTIALNAVADFWILFESNCNLTGFAVEAKMNATIVQMGSASFNGVNMILISSSIQGYKAGIHPFHVKPCELFFSSQN